MEWAEGKAFHGATPSAPLNKLALYIGDPLPYDGMQASPNMPAQACKTL